MKTSQAVLIAALFGTVAGDAGRADQCLSFSGAGHIRAGMSVTVNDGYYALRDGLTISAWIFPTQYGAAGTRPGIAGNLWSTGSVKSGFHLMQSANQQKFGFAAAVGTQEYFTDVAVPLNQWTHLMGVHNTEMSQISIYKNCKNPVVLAVAGGSVNYNQPNDFYIATFKDDDESDRFVGRIDEIRVWGVPITGENCVNEMYETLAGTELNLRSYWPMNSNSITATPDMVAGGKSGEYVGSGIQTVTSNAPIDQTPFALPDLVAQNAEKKFTVIADDSEVQFTVVGNDLNRVDSSNVNPGTYQLGDSPNLPPDAEYGAQSAGTPQRTFKWKPTLAEVWATPYKVKFPVTNVAHNLGNPASVSTTTLSGVSEVTIVIRCQPEWLAPTPLNNHPIWPYSPEHREEICVNYAYSYKVKASDRNKGDTVTIHFDTQLMPDVVGPGAFTPSNHEYWPDNAGPSHTVHRHWSWTAGYEQAGNTYQVCYTAKDDSDEPLNKPALSDLYSKTICMVLYVRAPPQFTGPFKNAGNAGNKEELVMNWMVGTEVSFDWRAIDPNQKTFIASGEQCYDTVQRKVVPNTQALCVDSCSDSDKLSKDTCIGGTCPNDVSKSTEETCISTCEGDADKTEASACISSCVDPQHTTKEACEGAGQSWRERTWRVRVWVPRVWTVRVWSKGQHCDMFPLSCKQHTSKPDNVKIYVLEDYGIPNGAILGESKCPTTGTGTGDTANPDRCNPATRTFTWKPPVGSEGKTYRVCATAKDDENACRAGGWWTGPNDTTSNVGSEKYNKNGLMIAKNVGPYTTHAENEIPLSSPLNLNAGEEYMTNDPYRKWSNNVRPNNCVRIAVTSPAPEWVEPVVNNRNLKSYVGCAISVKFQVQAPEYEPTLWESAGTCYKNKAKGETHDLQRVTNTHDAPALNNAIAGKELDINYQTVTVGADKVVIPAGAPIAANQLPVTKSISVNKKLFDIQKASDCPYTWESEMKPASATITPIAFANTQTKAFEITYTPKRGEETKKFKICMNAADVKYMTRLEKRCVYIEVQRCKYCVGDGNTLTMVSKHYHIDTNWMRLWTLNGNNLSPDMQKVSDPDNFQGSSTVDAANNKGALNIGVTYTIQPGDSLRNIAAHFGTTVKKILAVNPDYEGKINNITADDELCIVPCTDPYAGSQYTYSDPMLRTGATENKHWAW